MPLKMCDLPILNAYDNLRMLLAIPMVTYVDEEVTLSHQLEGHYMLCLMSALCHCLLSGKIMITIY